MNPEAPLTGRTLRILAIGNSFTADGTAYLSLMVRNANINGREICLYNATIPGASIDTWLDVYENDTPVKLTRMMYGIPMNEEGTLRQLLAQPWDVIVIQQVSTLSNRWENYDKLEYYIDIVRTHCPNKDMHIAFQQVWSHTPNEDPAMYIGNLECSQKVARLIGPQWIIPTGQAIQLARLTSLNDSKYMTCDNHHLNHGIACYTASATWFETLIAPVFKRSIMGNPATPKGNYTEEEILLSQQCAVQAVQSPFEPHLGNVASLLK